MPDVQTAKKLLEKATSDCKSAKEIADGHGKYAAAKLRAQDTLKELDKLPGDQKSLIAKDLESAKSNIDIAIAKAETDKQLDKAVALLQEAQTKLDQARTKADVQANLKSPMPNTDFLKMLAKEPGGTKALDDMVAQMDDSTSRVALEAALEARFNLDLQQFLSEDGITIGTPPNQKKVHGTADNRAPDKSVKRVYELMLKVPESHARNNPKVERIRRFQEDIGGAAYGGGEIDLGCGRAGATLSSDQGAQLCSPDYFPDGVDKDCHPPDEAKGKDVRYFDWATLHEVGHAVDDDNKFMDNNQSDPKYGGWVVYGADATVPATVANNHFKFNLQYIKDLLDGKTPAAPAKPADREQDDWDKTKAKVDEWCKLVSGLKLWWDGTGSKKVAIDGRVYQKSYKTPEWVSYELSARSKGIHGYQFRAPGEWFAELYAAYYMGMLKPEHPAVKDWLPSKLK